MSRCKFVFPSQPTELGTHFAGLAAITYLCLYHFERQNQLSGVMRDRAGFFSNTMQRLLRNAKFNFQQICDVALGGQLTDAERKRLYILWCETKLDVNGPLPKGATRSQDGQPDYSWRTVRFETRKMNLIDTRALWKRFTTELRLGWCDPATEAWAYSDFMWHFLAVSAHRDIIDVHNMMRHRKSRPGINHFLPLLLVHKARGDLKAVEAVWDEMLDNDVRPNNRAWTALLGCMLDQGQWKQAIERLEELSAQWKDMATTIGQLDEPPRTSVAAYYLPQIHPINAVLEGLIDSNNLTPVPAIVRWAQEHAAVPDVVTFTIVACHFVRGTSDRNFRAIVDEIARAARSSDAQSVKVLAKYLLAPEFSRLYTKSRTAQTCAVDAFLNEARETGAHCPPHIYSTIVHSVLASVHGPNFALAERIVDHSARQGVLPAPHQLSNIIGRSLHDVDPPRLDEAKALWRRAVYEGWTLDEHLYNATVTGFAKHGDVAFVRELREWAASAERETTWSSLTKIIEMLAGQGKTAEAWKVYQRVNTGREAPADSLDKTRFWVAMDDLGNQGLLLNPGAKTIQPVNNVKQM